MFNKKSHINGIRDNFLKAAAGITLMLQTIAPSALADSTQDGVAAQFTLASGGTAQRQYPALFGAQEIRFDDVSVFKKWTSAVSRFEEQTGSLSATAPRVMLWKAELRRLRDLPQKEQIAGINAFLNKTPYIEDRDNYGRSDFWATPVEFLTRGGDCEDFAIAKYASLRALGFSADQMRIAIVQDTVKNISHAILVVYTDDGTVILDNQDKKVERVANVTRYKPIFSINNKSWWLHKA